MLDSSDDNKRPPLVSLHSVATPPKSSPGLYHRPSRLGSTTLSTISESEPSIFDDGGIESNAHIPAANNASSIAKLNIPKNFSVAAAERWKGVNIQQDDEGGEGNEEGGGWKEVELDWDSDDDVSDEEEEDPAATASPSCKPSLSLRNIFRRRGAK